jgi:hypothetical protein
MNSIETLSGRTLSARKPTHSGLERAAQQLLFGVLPVALFFTLAGYAIAAGYGSDFGFDFKPVWQAAHNVLSGSSPYPAHLSALRSEQRFVYPPIAALLGVPFAAFPFAVAASLYALVLVGVGALTLRVLGVRDWRCYGIALLWPPVIQAITLGTVSLVLTLGLAVAWRYRDKRWVGPLVVAALIAGKVFLWPLLFWLVATRRGAGAVKALALSVAAVLGSWALIGFAGFTSYPSLLAELARLLQWKSYSAMALGMSLGFSSGEARVASFLAGGAVLTTILLLGRARGRDADLHAFIAAIAAAFLFTPIVWMHYLAMLLVPIAITRSRLTLLWFLPLVTFASLGQSYGELWKVTLGFLVWSLGLGLCLRRRWVLPSFGSRPVAARAAAAAKV